MSADVVAAAEVVLAERIVDHPMWQGVHYTMERERRVAAFVVEAAAALAAAGLLADPAATDTTTDAAEPGAPS